MKRILPFLLVLIFCTWAGGQELVLEKTPEDLFFFANEKGMYAKEAWKVFFRPGENQFLWDKPAGVNGEDVFILVEGGTLKDILALSQENERTITVVTDQEREGRIYFTYPLREVVTSFVYQFFWEEGKSFPSSTLFVDLYNQGQRTLKETRCLIGGSIFTIELDPGQTRRLKIRDFNVLSAEKLSTFDLVRFGDRDVHFSWSLSIPPELVYPAKVEYFEKAISGVVFLGEGSFLGEGPFMELEVGKSNDVTVEEKLLKQEKIDIRYSKNGEEVLYDTNEKKLCIIANRGTEKKKIEIFEHVQPCYELVSYSVPLEKIESDRFSFVLELPPQEKKEVILEVRGKNLTEGYIFR
ncbi:MAG: hypothetical protein NTX88_10240 [Candidatus Atribacteria bacterium]|nr:hypothetical protein [Candidatus Atribacteria bacterium]